MNRKMILGNIVVGFMMSCACFSANGQTWNSITVSCNRIMVEDSVETTVGMSLYPTVYSYPTITGLTDPGIERRLNDTLMMLVIDTAAVFNKESIVSVHQLGPNDSLPDSGYFLESLDVLWANKRLVSYLNTSFSPGGAHPNFHEYAYTIDLTTLQPIRLDSLFENGYRDVFRKALDSQHPGTTPEDSFFIKNWQVTITEQFDGTGMLITDSVLVLARDTELDFPFSSGHAGRQFAKITIPFTMLRYVIRSDGPLKQFIPKKK